MKRNFQGIVLAAVLLGPVALQPVAAHADGSAALFAPSQTQAGVLTTQVAGSGSLAGPGAAANRILTTPAGVASLRPDLITIVRDTGATFAGLSDTVDISIRNTGTLPAGNIETQISLPSNLRADKILMQTADFSCNITGPQTVSCIGGSLDGNNATAIIRLGFTAVAPGAGDIKSVVDPNNTIAETNESNNQDAWPYRVIQ